jgi:DNA-binding IclR family transcriptional regulator
MTPASTPLEPLDERKFVVALARGLDLLRAFRPGETMLGNRDFVERTGLPKATVNRLAYTLTVLGYLRLDESLGKYALDAGVLSLGFALLSGTDTLELARPHMRTFAREVGAAVSLGCRDGLDMIYLDTIRSETALTLGLASGSKLSMLTSSMGRAYLAVQALDVRAALMAELKKAAGKEGAALVADAAIRFATGTTMRTRSPYRFASRAKGAGWCSVAAGRRRQWGKRCFVRASRRG